MIGLEVGHAISYARIRVRGKGEDHDAMKKDTDENQDQDVGDDAGDEQEERMTVMRLAMVMIR